MSTTGNRLRRVLVSGAVVVGAGLGAAGVASAATGSSTTPSASGSGATAPATVPPADGMAPAAMTHGPDETLLTGSALAKATAAADAAVPGATVIRAETNSSGASPYEVHMKKSDGTDVTVELGSGFGLVATVPGFGAGPAGSQAPTGTASSAGGASPSAG